MIDAMSLAIGIGIGTVVALVGFVGGSMLRAYGERKANYAKRHQEFLEHKAQVECEIDAARKSMSH